LERKKIFFFIIFQLKQHKTLFLSEIKTFLRFGAKIKVTQNFILYNIASGYIWKFQLYFKIGI
jgi:hypothetical protein